MLKKGFRWLHLSDFHAGKDQYGQIRLFDSIIGHIRSKINADERPDIIFITGDIANKGKEEEYELFCNDFMFPLCDLLGEATKIFVVPGNHDVDCDQARATKRHGVVDEIPEFFDPDKNGLHERKVLFPRFENYVKADFHDLVTVGADWIFSQEGFFTHILEKDGVSVGMLGLNTAWLSDGDLDDTDRHRLTPGKPMVEEGLKKLGTCNIRFVLGHHPVDWYDEDETPIRSLFGKRNIIYLCGHLHKTGGGPEVGAGRRFLPIHCGAAFQARENEKWVNRLLWCELGIAAHGVHVEPRQWSKAYQEWALDGTAYPEEYRAVNAAYWVLPMKDTPPKTAARAKVEDDTMVLPQGWQLIDKTFLEGKQSGLTDDSILSFFDGRVPSWSEALTTKIPRRLMVRDIVAELANSHEKGELRVTVILGAGGEGKSTIFYQTICDLALATSGWKIMWLANPARDILWPNKFLMELPPNEGGWLIASDDADLIAKYVFETAKSFRMSERRDIQFLLCCRDSDWLAIEANEWQWGDHVTYTEKRLRGITQKDAELIIKAWSQFGSKGLGNLSGLSFSEVFVNS